MPSIKLTWVDPGQKPCVLGEIRVNELGGLTFHSAAGSSCSLLNPDVFSVAIQLCGKIFEPGSHSLGEAFNKGYEEGKKRK